MSIVVECPHCQTRFNLQAEMNGKTMRCPNLECRMGFVVKAKEAAAPPPAFEPPPEPKAAPKPAPPKPAAKPPKPRPAKPPEVVDAVVVDAAVVSTPKVKEVVWSEGTDVPPPKKGGRKAVKAEVADDTDDLPVRRKKKGSRGPLVLAGMGVAIGAIAIFAVVYILYFQGKAEENLALEAKKQYEEKNYAEAEKHYNSLVTDYPGSKDVEEYKFFGEISAMQREVRSLATRDNYEPALKKFNAFVAEHKDSPLAKPTSGYGRDLLDAGKKLAEDIATFAAARVEAFKSDRANKSAELELAERAVADGRALIDSINPFRAADDGEEPLNRLRGLLADVEGGVRRERARTEAIASATAKLADPTDKLIQDVESELRAAGFLDDPEAQSLVATAKGKLRDLVQYVNDPGPAQPPPPTAAASLLFVTKIGATKFHESAPNDPPPTVFLCVARGILYAFEEDEGALLWAMRVGPDVIEPPVVARAPLSEGPTDLAVVTSNVGNAPAVAGVVLRTGATRWYQPLPAPAAGPAAVVGNRAFIPVRDAVGTVFEFDITTGARIGYIQLGQPVADRGAVIRPGTGYLYVAADANRVYVIDAGGKNLDGNRVDPRCAQVIATGHTAGSLRLPPLFVGPEGTTPASRWIVLTQADGTERTLLRAFAVEAVVAPADGAPVPETPARPIADSPINGWVSFTPLTDGERLAVLTDTGSFHLFGVPQAGNVDKPLFPYKPAEVAGPGGRVVPGLAIPAGESTYWLVSGGRLQKSRLALVPSKGQEVVFAGSPRPVGEPVHAAQVNGRRDTVCIVVRSLTSSGCRAVAFNLKDGEIRWQRQLGFVPAKLSPAGPAAAPVVQGDGFILADEDGGVFAIPASPGVGIGEALTVPQPWAIAEPPADPTGPTVTASSADGKVVFTITPTDREKPKFIIRRVEGGKKPRDEDVIAPAALAGQPAVVGGFLHIPAADGFIYRFIPGEGVLRGAKLEPGPSWHVERRGASAVCGITPLTDSSFTTSDGGRKLSRWEWATPNGKWNPGGEWEFAQEVAAPGMAIPPAEAGSPPRLIVADAGGTVWLFAADRAGGEAIRRWKPGAEGGIPAGKPTSGFATQAGGAKQTAVTYVVERKAVVAINPDADEPLWVAQADDAAHTLVGAPQPAGENRWMVTDLAGSVLLIDGESGKLAAALSVGLQGAVPAAASGAASGKALTPLFDGSAVAIELPKPAEEPKKEKE